MIFGCARQEYAAILRWLGVFYVLPLICLIWADFACAQGAVVLQQEPVLPIAPDKSLHLGKVALGRKLFHDRRLSKDNSISCASCHDLARGGADSQAFSAGIKGAKGQMNAPTVYNAGLNFRQFWDGRAASLHEQAAGPIHDPVEMGSSWSELVPKLQADAEYRKLFSELYHTAPNAEVIQDALAEFERSLLTPARMDRWLKGDATALNAHERAGYALFKRHGCATCHQGANVGGNMYQRFGIMRDYFADKPVRQSDQGRFNVTGREQDRYVFKVPGLRNVALTAPYFHDGSAATLEEAVALMGLYQLGVQLPQEDVMAIVAFLRTLTGEKLE